MELCVGERLGKTRTNRKTSHRQRPARVNGRADRLHAERTRSERDDVIRGLARFREKIHLQDQHDPRSIQSLELNFALRDAPVY